MKYIYITGCAKTRTTMVQQLMFAFKDTIVIPAESSARMFMGAGERRSKTNLVIKRRANGFLANYKKNIIKPELDAILAIKPFIIFVTRNREDTLKSDNGYVSAERYDTVHKDAETYKHLIAFTIDTDELLKDPDTMQKKLADKLGLVIVHKWSNYPDFVPDYMFDYHNYRKRKLGEPA